MLASRLGQWLGLPVPRVEVIEVSDWLIANSSEMRVDVGGLGQEQHGFNELSSDFSCRHFCFLGVSAGIVILSCFRAAIPPFISPPSFSFPFHSR